MLLNADFGAVLPPLPAGDPAEPALLVDVPRAPALPGLELVDADLEYLRDQVVYLDTDGERSVIYDGSVKVGPFDVPALRAPGNLAGLEQTILTEGCARLRQIFAGAGVAFALDRPVGNQPYSTVYVGGDGSAWADCGSLAGLAETEDVGNRNRGDDAFVFPEELRAEAIDLDSYVRRLVDVIAHEVGHLLGMQHVGAEELTEPIARVAYMQGDLYGPVHQYLTSEAFDFYASQFRDSELGEYIGQMPGTRGLNTTVLEGSCDEDRGSECPWGNAEGHLWGQYPDGTRSWDYSGSAGEDSAVNRAYEYFTGGQALEPDYPLFDGRWQTKGDGLGHGITWVYAKGNKARAYYWLGHVAHLLEDVTLPAHALAAHALFDKYESYTARSGNWTLWGFPTADLRGGPTGEIRLPQDTWEALLLDPLYYLFEETAEAADDFDSDLANGEEDHGARRANGINDAEARAVGDAMMPIAMKAVAELFRYFYGLVDHDAPEVNLVTSFGADEGGAVLKPSRFHLAALAQDDLSGYDADGFHFIIERKNGDVWEHVVVNPNAGQFEFTAPGDGLYRITVAVSDAAGNVGRSDTGYFRVEQAAGLTPVYRFWSPVIAHHFYTIRVSERDKLIYNYAGAWIYEGIAYYAFAQADRPGVVPIYRFWSGALGSHFFTTDAAEKTRRIDNEAAVWTYEGIAFYVYPGGSQPAGTSGVYRFQSPTRIGHFYTLSQTERDKLLTLSPLVWTYELIAWYAYEA